MSHFVVAVLMNEENNSLEDLLAPYQENDMEDCPEEYLEFIECDESDIEKYKEHQDKYKTLDEFMEEYHGYQKNTETGKYGYYDNLNAKWDWYVVGGRWSNLLLLKNGEYSDSAKIKDIDWDKMKELKRVESEAIWDSKPEGIFKYYSGIFENDTKETFLERASEFSTYAVVTPDGEWHAKGEMGWFGVSSEDDEDATKWSKGFYDTFIKNADPETEIAIVDCHI